MRIEAMRAEELENCENCRFSFWAVPEKTLICRRVPPVTIKNSFAMGRSLFSQTHRSVWCGEWRGKGGLTWGEKGVTTPRPERLVRSSLRRRETFPSWMPGKGEPPEDRDEKDAGERFNMSF